MSGGNPALAQQDAPLRPSVWGHRDVRRFPLPPQLGSGAPLLLQRQKSPLGQPRFQLCSPTSCRPKTYHTSLKVAWDLNTGIFVTVNVGDLTEVKGQTR